MVVPMDIILPSYILLTITDILTYTLSLDKICASFIVELNVLYSILSPMSILKSIREITHVTTFL